MTEPCVSSLNREPTGRAHHELCRVLAAGELGERLGYVAADDLVVLATEVGEQLAMPLE